MRAAAGAAQTVRLPPQPRPLHWSCPLPGALAGPPPVCTNTVSLPGSWPHRHAGLLSGVVPSSPGRGEGLGRRPIAPSLRYFPLGSFQDCAPSPAHRSKRRDRQRTPRIGRPGDPPPRSQGLISSSAATGLLPSALPGWRRAPGQPLRLSRSRTNAKARPEPGGPGSPFRPGAAPAWGGGDRAGHHPRLRNHCESG